MEGLLTWQTLGHEMPQELAVDWNGLSQKAWSTMYPSMAAGAPSVINFLLELKDLRRLADLKKLRFLTDRSKWYRRRQTAKYVAGAHLTWSFGIAPFVRDVVELWKSLFDWRERYKALLRGANKLQRSHYRFHIDDYALPPDKYQGFSTSYERTTHEWVTKPVYNATALYRYAVPQGPLAEVAALLDRLGARLDPRILWEAIPFSFVVDWFIDVGGWLRQYSADNLGVQVELLDFCHSVKFCQRANLYGLRGNSPEFHLWSAQVRSYRRIRAIPVMFKSISAGSGFGFQQGALAASLLGSRAL
jgi:hypothetical protein